MNRRVAMLGFFVLVVLAGWPISSFGESSIRIVDNGKPMASIAISKDASEQVHSAARLLQDYVKRASKATLPIREASDIRSGENKQALIWVGPSEYVNTLKSGLNQLDDDGFIIVFPDKKNIVIVGPTDWGTEFGVYEFLERYMGVRWLLPGPEGEHVPEHLTLDIPIQEVREEPSFFSRHLFGLRGKAQSVWARRNRLHSRIEFHHNLLKLFPAGEYTKTQPDFFPILNGKRYLPPADRTHGWQPCFTAPGIVDEAIKNICNYFSENREKTSYSLGVNDNSGHCECEKCLARDSGKKNFTDSNGFCGQVLLYPKCSDGI
jgi:hypothetical protein